MDVLNGIAEITAEAEEITHDDTKDKDLVSISFILNNRNIFLIRKYVIGISWTNGISFPRWQWTSRSRRILSVCILFLLNNTIYNPSINLPVCDTVCPSFGNQKCQPVNLYYILYHIVVESPFGPPWMDIPFESILGLKIVNCSLFRAGMRRAKTQISKNTTKQTRTERRSRMHGCRILKKKKKKSSAGAWAVGRLATASDHTHIAMWCRPFFLWSVGSINCQPSVPSLFLLYCPLSSLKYQ